MSQLNGKLYGGCGGCENVPLCSPAIGNKTVCHPQQQPFRTQHALAPQPRFPCSLPVIVHSEGAKACPFQQDRGASPDQLWLENSPLAYLNLSWNCAVPLDASHPTPFPSPLLQSWTYILVFTLFRPAPAPFSKKTLAYLIPWWRLLPSRPELILVIDKC